MDRPFTLSEGVDSWNTIIFLYRSALKEVSTKVEILNDEFQQVHQYNPIEYIKSRIKSPESIVKKLKRGGYEVTIPNMIEHLSDIAGIRIICSFSPDIYRIAEMIARQSDVTVLVVKDYIKNPKPNGYRSYHMIVEVNLGHLFSEQTCRVEIQLRTSAMDFWATLEHKVRYKYDGQIPEQLSGELQNCAEQIHALDERMYLIHKVVDMINQSEVDIEQIHQTIFELYVKN